MYFFGSALTAMFKVSFAFLGLYGAVTTNPAAVAALIENYVWIVIETALPFFLTANGFVGWIEAIVTFVLNVAFGLGIATIKYSLATQGRY